MARRFSWSGGGAPAFDDFYIAGRYYSGFGGTATSGAVAGSEIYLVPLEIHVAHAFDEVAVQVTAAAVGVGSVIRLGFYTESAGTWTRLVDAGTVDPLTIGLQAAPIALTLAAGLVWAAVNQQTAEAGTDPSLVRRQATVWSPFIGQTAAVLGAGNLPRNCYRTTAVNSGVLPASIALAGTVLTDVGPMVHLRAV